MRSHQAHPPNTRHIAPRTNPQPPCLIDSMPSWRSAAVASPLLLLLSLLLSPCGGYAPCSRPRNLLRSALPAARHASSALPLFMREADTASPPRRRKRQIIAKMLKEIGGRFRMGKKVQYECGVNKYGCDPRGTEPDVSQAAAAIIGGTDAAASPTPATSEFEAGVVNVLRGGITAIADILQQNQGSERLVVIKFKRTGCMACASSVEPMASAARAWADRADFFEVDYHQSKALCTACGIRVVPCVHLYSNATLVDTMPLGPSAWADFAARVEELAGEPDGEVLAPKVKPKAAEDGNYPFFD
jgi:hypothetical protein